MSLKLEEWPKQEQFIITQMSCNRRFTKTNLMEVKFLFLYGKTLGNISLSIEMVLGYFIALGAQLQVTKNSII